LDDFPSPFFDPRSHRESGEGEIEASHRLSVAVAFEGFSILFNNLKFFPPLIETVVQQGAL
jgi:hypothetical protein